MHHPLPKVTAVPDDAAASDADALLDDLDPEQRAAVTSTGAPLCIVAGPGAGRCGCSPVASRTDSRRPPPTPATSSSSPSPARPRPSSTVGSARWAYAGRRLPARSTPSPLPSCASAGPTPASTAPSLLDRKAGLLAPLVSQSAKRGGQAQYVQPADVAAEIEWAKARMINPGAYTGACDEAGRRPAADTHDRGVDLRALRAAEARTRAIDFDDVLILCAHARSRDDRDFAAVQRWRFRHLFVDEFQDINPLQLHLLEAWRGERPDLCVVGDPDQAIYGWNGADIRALARLRRSLLRVRPSCGSRPTHRSTPQIVRTASRVLARRSGATVQGDGPIPSISRAPDRRRRSGSRGATHPAIGVGPRWVGAISRSSPAPTRSSR